MKIVEIVFHLNSGGAERFVVDLSNELSKTNEVVLLALKEDKSNPEEFLFYKFDLSERVKYKNVGLPSYSYKPSTMWQVYKAIKAENPDVVHMHAAGM
ncbi:glycosyltransferase family 4 protein, partial [Prevotella sp. CAG:255]|uniref:glycosyltransferase family 4 protein n=1 Tax=Prevotella sp. CAG:255 TaxID=1262923 RepID=UPI000AEABB13